MQNITSINTFGTLVILGSSIIGLVLTYFILLVVRGKMTTQNTKIDQQTIEIMQGNINARDDKIKIQGEQIVTLQLDTKLLKDEFLKYKVTTQEQVKILTEVNVELTKNFTTQPMERTIEMIKIGMATRTLEHKALTDTIVKSFELALISLTKLTKTQTAILSRLQ